MPAPTTPRSPTVHNPRLHHLPAIASPEALAAICPVGHALTKAQVERGGGCPFCPPQQATR